VSYSQIKINYQKGPSTEELTNEINLDDYFENPEFNNNKKHTLKKSSTFRKDKNGFYPELSSFTKSKSVNSLFIAQYGNSEIDFSNEQLANEKNKIEENKSEENINEDNKNKEKKIEENKIEENKFEENKIEEKKLKRIKLKRIKLRGVEMKIIKMKRRKNQMIIKMMKNMVPLLLFPKIVIKVIKVHIKIYQY